MFQDFLSSKIYLLHGQIISLVIYIVIFFSNLVFISYIWATFFCSEEASLCTLSLSLEHDFRSWTWRPILLQHAVYTSCGEKTYCTVLLKAESSNAGYVLNISGWRSLTTASRRHFERCRSFRHHVRRKWVRRRSNRAERLKQASRAITQLVLTTRANFSYMCWGRGGNWSQLQQCRQLLYRRKRTLSSRGFWWVDCERVA